MKRISIVWFRSDLRLHDNEALSEAAAVSDLVFPVYVFDKRIFEGKTSFGFRKTAWQRCQFVIESVTELRESLRERGSDLIVRKGYPEEELFLIAKEIGSSWVYCNRERTSEEVTVQDRLEKKLWTIGQELRFERGKMLLYTQDLPFPVNHMPDNFQQFRKQIEFLVPVRRPLEIPALPYLPALVEPGDIPQLCDFDHHSTVTSEGIGFKGGEKQGLDHLARWTNTANSGSQSGLSPWISQGCLSPKTAYFAAGKNSTGTYFQINNEMSLDLLWRDYFRLIGKKYGNRIFQPSGPRGIRDMEQRIRDARLLEKKVGVPEVDNCLEELRHTGYLSHDKRALLAHTLIHQLNFYWLLGAEYFESFLIDYDPCSNYGNWNMLAGIGPEQARERSQLSMVKSHFLKKY